MSVLTFRVLPLDSGFVGRGAEVSCAPLSLQNPQVFPPAPQVSIVEDVGPLLRRVFRAWPSGEPHSNDRGDSGRSAERARQWRTLEGARDSRGYSRKQKR